MQETKTYSVKEAAELLGLSVITVRRRIKENQLRAELPSDKEGYRISEESLKEFAAKHASKVGTLWSKGIAGAAATVATLAALGSNTATVGGATGAMFASALSSTLLIGGPLGIALGAILTPHMSQFNTAQDSVELEKESLRELDNPVVIDRVIDRLKAEMEDFDLRIDYQMLKTKQAGTDEAKMAEQEKLLELKLQKNKINKDIKDLEIRKSLLQEKMRDNATIGSQVPSVSSETAG